MWGWERWKTCPTHFQKTTELTGLSQKCFQMDATAVILGSLEGCSLGLLAAPRTADHRLSVWMEEGCDGDSFPLKLQSWEDWPHTSHSHCFSLWWRTVNLLGCCHRGKDAAKPVDLVWSYLDPETTFLQLLWGEFPRQTSVPPVSVIHDHHISDLTSAWMIGSCNYKSLQKDRYLTSIEAGWGWGQMRMRASLSLPAGVFLMLTDYSRTLNHLMFWSTHYHE